MNDRAMGIARIAGPQLPAAPTHFSMAWGEIADCVYRQNARALCEPNNRALAVEAAASVVREVNALTAPQQSESSFAKTYAAVNGAATIKRNIDQLRDIKDRVLTGLRARLQDGRLIAADFGYLPQADLKRVLQDTKPTRNGCAEEGLGG
jgi:hypothetical protein